MAKEKRAGKRLMQTRVPEEVAILFDQLAAEEQRTTANYLRKVIIEHAEKMKKSKKGSPTS
jgi:predicted DNA-binding protein